MTINYTTLLGLTEPVTGTQSGTWGSDINTGLTDYVEAAIAGAQVISGSQTAVTLSVTTGSSSAPTTLSQAGSGATGSSQYQIIRCTGNPAGLLTITAPASDKTYVILNATSTSQAVKIVGAGPTTGVTIVSGERAFVAWNGSDFVKVGGAAGGTNTQVQYNNNGVFGGVSGATTNGTAITFSTTNLKLQGSSTGVSSFASANSSASDYTYTFPAANTTIPVATQTLTFSGPTAARTITLPDANFTAARTDAAQTFTGTQTFSSDASVNGLTVGRGAGAVSTNTAVGASALAGSVTGTRSTGVGYEALKVLTSGDPNTAFGAYALKANTTGPGNVGIGAYALQTNISGGSNTAVGNEALIVNTASYNTAIGAQALVSNTTASNNTAVGYQAGYTNTTGTQNNFFGTQAGYSSTTDNQAFFGYQAGYNTTTGTQNTVMGGYRPFFSNTTGAYNTVFGSQALYSNTTGVATFGTVTGGSGYTNGTYNGVQLTYSSGTTATTYPTANIVVSGGAVTTVTLVSAGTGFKDTTTVLTAPAASIGGTGSGFTVPVSTLAAASNNTAVGYQAGYSNITGTANTYLGYQAGYEKTGSYNVALGFQALRLNGGGTSNVAIGINAGYVSTGSYNTFVGGGSASYGCGELMTTGSKNSIFGAFNGNQGGLDIRTANNYIVLSDGDGKPRAGYHVSYAGFFINQESAAVYSQFNYLIDGVQKAAMWWDNSLSRLATYTNAAGPYVANGGTSWTSSSDERLKNITGEIQNGLAKVVQLRAAEFTWKSDETAKPQVGLIAQDVLAVLPQAVNVPEEGSTEKDGSPAMMGVQYTDVIPLLVASIKELKTELDSVKAELATLKGA